MSAVMPMQTPEPFDPMVDDFSNTAMLLTGRLS